MSNEPAAAPTVVRSPQKGIEGIESKESIEGCELRAMSYEPATALSAIP